MLYYIIYIYIIIINKNTLYSEADLRGGARGLEIFHIFFFLYSGKLGKHNIVL